MALSGITSSDQDFITPAANIADSFPSAPGHSHRPVWHRPYLRTPTVADEWRRLRARPVPPVRIELPVATAGDGVFVVPLARRARERILQREAAEEEKQRQRQLHWKRRLLGWAGAVKAKAKRAVAYVCRPLRREERCQECTRRLCYLTKRWPGCTCPVKT